MRRDSTVLGVQQCSTPVVWAEGDDRAEMVTRVRRCEGADCDVSGDVLLFQLADGRRALVIEDLS